MGWGVPGWSGLSWGTRGWSWTAGGTGEPGRIRWIYPGAAPQSSPDPGPRGTQPEQSNHSQVNLWNRLIDLKKIVQNLAIKTLILIYYVDLKRNFNDFISDKTISRKTLSREERIYRGIKVNSTCSKRACRVYWTKSLTERAKLILGKSHKFVDQ